MSRKKTRIYTRNQGGVTRYYADFRDLGGGREALIPEGDRRATTDRVVAEALVAKRLGELQEAKRDRVLLGVKRRVGLVEYAVEHLVAKKESGNFTDGWLSAAQHHLEVAAQFLCNGGEPLPRLDDGEVDWEKVPDRELASIGVEHVRDYARWLATQPNGRYGTLQPASRRKYLNSLSNLFRRAQSESIIRAVNPVQALMEKPNGAAAEARWLEVWEGALLLEAARTFPYGYRPPDGRAGRRLELAIREVLGEDGTDEFVRRMRAAGRLTTAEKVATYVRGDLEPTKRYLLVAAQVLGVPPERLYRGRSEAVAPERIHRMIYPLIATYLLTGGRETEVYGLEMRDVNLEREIVVFRVTPRRRLKTKTSSRILPLWPQLAEILEPWLKERREAGASDHDLIFPAPHTGRIIADCRKALDAIASRAGWEKGDIRTKMFRHTYCAARLQTLDGGHPVSLFSVGKELGHGGEALVKRVYGHLGRNPHRSEHVEYRIEQQRDIIPPERLKLLIRAV